MLTYMLNHTHTKVKIWKKSIHKEGKKLYEKRDTTSQTGWREP